MNISGIRPRAEFYSYNSIKASELRSQQVLGSHKAETQTKDQSEGQQPDVDLERSHKREQSYTSYDYAQLYHQEKDYPMKGNEADLRSLDLEQVKSDLDKDKILQQYQYFVRGNGGAEMSHTQSGQRMSENFML